MKYSLLKSAGAIVAGMAAGAVLSVMTDKILESTGLMKTDPFDANPPGLIAVVVFYRTLFNLLGAFVAAKLAPSKPMKHALILGVIGTAIGILGTVTMWHIPPHWYPISLVILTMPAAWLGGQLAIKTSKLKNIEK
ncbi:hypothetical protein CNR22_18735 [Sphingobacteriaceae bacterium]|nr:hypothetical protein CNR22_18735 [Sphingobacteriaceae bacterium]